MKRKLFCQLFTGGVFLITTLLLISCDELIGEFDNPVSTEPTTALTPASIGFALEKKFLGTEDGNFTLVAANTGDGTVSYSSEVTSVATVNPTTGEVTPIAAGTTHIIATVEDSENYGYETKTAQYTLEVGEGYRILKWDETKKDVVSDFATGTVLEGSIANTAITNATYIIKGNVTTTGSITLSGATTLVLLNGAKLSVTGKISGNGNDLAICAQSEGEDMGELEVTQPDDFPAIAQVMDFNIYGGKITATTQGHSTMPAIEMPLASQYLNIYGGDVTVQGSHESGASDGGAGIHGNNITITGKAVVTAKGGNYTGTSDGIKGGYGIYAANLVASGQARVFATGGDSTDGTNTKGGIGLSNLTIEGDAYVKAQGGKGHGVEQGGLGIAGSTTYNGGQIEAYGGLNGDETTYNTAIWGTLVNGIDDDVTFQISDDGTTWADYPLTPNQSVDVSSTPAIQKPCFRKTN